MASKQPRFTGVKQLAARVGDFLFYPVLENVLWWVLGLSCVLIHRNVITTEFVDRWNNRGVTVMAWTVNCPTEKKFYSKFHKIPVLSDTLRN